MPVLAGQYLWRRHSSREGSEPDKSPNTMVLMVALIATPISAILWSGMGNAARDYLGLARLCRCSCNGWTRLPLSKDMVAAGVPVLPYEYTRLIFVALMGFLLFEVPGLGPGLSLVILAPVYTSPTGKLPRANLGEKRAAQPGNSARRLRRADFETSPLPSP